LGYFCYHTAQRGYQDQALSRPLAVARALKTTEVVSLSINIDLDHDDIMYPDVVPFLAVHAGCVAAIWSGVTWQAIAVCVVLYWLRMFAITGGYHRYFSHRAYSTSRAFQLRFPILLRILS
jgi:stearoyl-CoA desaturase (Delta-9 desaturase)